MRVHYTRPGIIEQIEKEDAEREAARDKKIEEEALRKEVTRDLEELQKRVSSNSPITSAVAKAELTEKYPKIAPFLLGTEPFLAPSEKFAAKVEHEAVFKEGVASETEKEYVALRSAKAEGLSLAEYIEKRRAGAKRVREEKEKAMAAAMTEGNRTPTYTKEAIQEEEARKEEERTPSYVS
jgi:hypothetical protein